MLEIPIHVVAFSYVYVDIYHLNKYIYIYTYEFRNNKMFLGDGEFIRESVHAYFDKSSGRVGHGHRSLKRSTWPSETPIKMSMTIPSSQVKRLPGSTNSIGFFKGTPRI